MKRYFLLLIVLLTGCNGEKNFADNITLNFPKDEKLIFQEFNDDLTHPRHITDLYWRNSSSY
ncbi:hypothetical protein SAMN05444408_108101 [Chryseobacterium takakiae]|uniref:Uncharacterized protein n=1 Tax=Chryseobacterium takakiae TaxID=1302685 RepID=A0A1M4YLX8_9FLAO|nr:hypothetical protein SAMN05444408_108101 [Chryseobacterium takakiae]